MRKTRPIARAEGLKRDASLVVIASEDCYAVKQYFEFFQSSRIKFHVLQTDEGKSSPSHVMDRLRKYMKEYDIGEGDQLWLVCDTDHWAQPNHIKNLVQVIKQCRQTNIGVALSNPCFDLWLLLHFEDCPEETHLGCDDIAGKIRDSVGKYNKKKVFNLPITNEGVRDAINRSKANQPIPGDVPVQTQTKVHLIIEDLIERRLIAAAP